MTTPAPEISIVIPSLRPDKVEKALERVHRYSGGVEYEVLVVSPQQPSAHERVVHLLERQPAGIVNATNAGVEASRGKWVLTFADDMLLNPGSLSNLLHKMRQREGELFLGSLRGYTGQHLWSTPGYFVPVLACCPCIERSQLAKIGGFLFDPGFRSTFNDHDLSARVHYSGGKVEICEDAWFESVSIVDGIGLTYRGQDYVNDSRFFFERWEPIAGAEYGYSWNHKEHMRGQESVREPFKETLPPEWSWQLRLMLHRSELVRVAECVNGAPAEWCLSQRGIEVFAQQLVEQAAKVSQETFAQLMRWLVTFRG